jgi:predicted ferric reductase
VSWAIRGAFWAAVYLTVVIAPLVFAAVGTPPTDRGFWLEFSVALAFVGLAMMGLQFALVARFKAVAAPFGEDAVVQFHRLMSYFGTLFILAHPIILILLVSSSYLRLLNPVSAPWRARFGLLSVILLLIVMVSSIWRRQLRIRYEWWQLIHMVAATLAVVAALVHVELVHYYVTSPWKRALWAAMTAGFVALIIWVRVVKPIMRLRRPWEVERVARERGDSWTITLRPVGHDGFSFAPGQFGWLALGRSPFGLTQHPFSFSSSAEQAGRVQMTIKELGDFTRTVGSIKPGTRAYLDGPHGVFSPDRHEGPGFVLLGAGVGIGPLISMLRTFADRQERRVCVLFYANRRLDGAALVPEIDGLSKRLSLEVVQVVEEPPADWQGERGRIDEALLRRHLPPRYQRMQYFVCGPEPFQDAMEEILPRLGVSAERVHSERFNFV